MWEWLKNPYSLSIVLLIAGVVLSQLCHLLWNNLFKHVRKRGEGKIRSQLLGNFRFAASASIFLTFTFFAVEALTPSPYLTSFARAILGTVGILLWSSACLSSVRIIIIWVRELSNSKDNFFKEKSIPLLELLTRLFISLGASYALLITWGVNVGAILASAGFLGVVLGFAAKDSLSNLFSGFFIMVDSPCKKGDYIQLETGERGYITEIGMRSTRLMTRDDIEVIIPNSILANTRITNESGGHHVKERIRVNVGVSYDSDIEKVKRVLLDLCQGVSGISTEPKSRVRFREMGDFSLKLQLLFWIDEPALRGSVIDVINTRIINEFREKGINIPFPQSEIKVTGFRGKISD
jgi:MscS family membrane protein